MLTLAVRSLGSQMVALRLEVLQIVWGALHSQAISLRRKEPTHHKRWRIHDCDGRDLRELNGGIGTDAFACPPVARLAGVGDILGREVDLLRPLLLGELVLGG